MALVGTSLVGTALGLCLLAHTAGAQPAAAEFAALPGWTADRVSEGVAAFAASCPRLDPAFKAACTEVVRVPPNDDAAARAFLQWAFRPVLVGGAQFTGYFELDVNGSPTRTGAYRWPLLKPPADPGRFARAAILGGALANQNLELVWLASAADLYFVQLQGSARVRLSNGTVLRVGGEVQNGRASIPTADLFATAGIPNHDLSIPAIRAWARAHEGEAEGLLARETSYFFFAQRQITADQGPVGALGVALTPLRSVAIDPGRVKLGGPLWVDAEVTAQHRPLQRLMLAQDTGEPIRGPGHLDVFFGSGTAAEAVGGRQNASGRYWLLAPR